MYLQVDLTGGYYDAGDNVKFGFPLAFSATMLAWSVLEFGGMMKGELQHARDAVRWGSDYLLKATAHPDTVYVQVPTSTHSRTRLALVTGFSFPAQTNKEPMVLVISGTAG